MSHRRLLHPGRGRVWGGRTRCLRLWGQRSGLGVSDDEVCGRMQGGGCPLRVVVLAWKRAEGWRGMAVRQLWGSSLLVPALRGQLGEALACACLPVTAHCGVCFFHSCVRAPAGPPCASMQACSPLTACLLWWGSSHWRCESCPAPCTLSWDGDAVERPPLPHLGVHRTVHIHALCIPVLGGHPFAIWKLQRPLIIFGVRHILHLRRPSATRSNARSNDSSNA